MYNAFIHQRVRGAVRFDDESIIDIHSLGLVVMEGCNDKHEVLVEVYFIPN